MPIPNPARVMRREGFFSPAPVNEAGTNPQGTRNTQRPGDFLKRIACFVNMPALFKMHFPIPPIGRLGRPFSIWSAAENGEGLFPRRGRPNTTM
jgi:hypothetical protein